jgi:hypothetical protein
MEASSSSSAPPPSIPPSSDQGVWADASQLVAAACAGKLDASDLPVHLLFSQAVTIEF